MLNQCNLERVSFTKAGNTLKNWCALELISDCKLAVK